MNRLSATLTSAEEEDLSRLEKVVRRSLGQFMEVGAALLEIRERKLFRETHESFEDYAAERFGISERHANRLIAAAEVVENTGGPNWSPVDKESQARELSQFTPEFQKKVVAQLKGPSSATVISEAALDLGKKMFSNLQPQDKAAIAKCSSKRLTSQARAVNRKMLINNLIQSIEKIKKRSRRLGSQDLIDNLDMAITVLRSL